MNLSDRLGSWYDKSGIGDYSLAAKAFGDDYGRHLFNSTLLGGPVQGFIADSGQEGGRDNMTRNLGSSASILAAIAAGVYGAGAFGGGAGGGAGSGATGSFAGGGAPITFGGGEASLASGTTGGLGLGSNLGPAASGMSAFEGVAATEMPAGALTSASAGNPYMDMLKKASSGMSMDGGSGSAPAAGSSPSLELGSRGGGYRAPAPRDYTAKSPVVFNRRGAFMYGW